MCVCQEDHHEDLGEGTASEADDDDDATEVCTPMTWLHTIMIMS